jgi:hypothetical protein
MATEAKKIERVILNPDGSATVRLRHVRLSYPALFQMRGWKNEPDKKSFGASFLFPRDGTKDQHKNTEVALKALRHCIAVGLKGVNPGQDRVCVRSGAAKADKEGYGPDVVYIATKAYKRPVVVDVDNSPLAEEDGKPYAGCYVNATVRFRVQNNSYGKRVNAQLKAVQFCADGEPFGEGSVDPDEEFETSATGEFGGSESNIDLL